MKTKQVMKQLVINLFSNNWTKWTLIHIYNFNLTNRSIEVRQNIKDGRVQFRVKRITYPVYGNYFTAEDVKKALSNVI